MSGEPVAWLVRYPTGFSVAYVSRGAADLHVRNLGGTIVPLFERPAPAASEARRG